MGGATEGAEEEGNGCLGIRWRGDRGVDSRLEMRVFSDTLILVAAFRRRYSSHTASLEVVRAATRGRSNWGLCSLAEVYAWMTALAVKETIMLAQALGL